jgi:hypothetical protein
MNFELQVLVVYTLSYRISDKIELHARFFFLLDFSYSSCLGWPTSSLTHPLVRYLYEHLMLTLRSKCAGARRNS